MGLLTAMLPSLLACASSPKQVAVEASCEELSGERTITRDVELAVGDSLTVTLCSNPTTGFQWEPAQVTNAGVLRQTESRYVAPEANRPGAAGRMLWAFKPLKPGNATVSLDYSRPWQGGEKAAWKFVLNVLIK
ncbi:MAG: protease inhibitor I42 family protein [Chloroflexi bacterium]|nr:protease inhibitor I42 family protein [Chloroflexota bacterium]